MQRTPQNATACSPNGTLRRKSDSIPGAIYRTTVLPHSGEHRPRRSTSFGLQWSHPHRDLTGNNVRLLRSRILFYHACLLLDNMFTLRVAAVTEKNGGQPDGHTHTHTHTYTHTHSDSAITLAAHARRRGLINYTSLSEPLSSEMVQTTLVHATTSRISHSFSHNNYVVVNCM